MKFIGILLLKLLLNKQMRMHYNQVRQIQAT